MKITKVFLGLAALTLTASLEAASIKYAVKVPGYSGAGWIQVRPELRSILGGRVAYLPQYGGWVTDRAARGEAIRTTIAPNQPGEGQGTTAWITLKINGVPVFPTFTGALTFVDYRSVSTNPNDDNISVSAYTIPGGYTEERVPIGSRPR